ncbi:nuclear transport factor 2 family protein [uncultured Sulfitobacter sp.]|uniref:nuclear transport factor 2 family protein n=1 Tax=uncultured Sulfitobacter sp. TaxID=191468 RepID=UPI00262F310B|nr:nuclear transport factor 2 family protein [uncultured Sulfitobacter sp.]
MKFLHTLALFLALTGPLHAQNTAFLKEPNSLVAEDDLAVRQVIARLNQALDSGDYAVYGSFFADDAVFTSGFGDATGPAGVAAALEQVRPFITNKRHVSANLVINGAGDRAVVTSYLIVFERVADLSYVGSAINIDTLEKRGGRWLVTRHDSELDPATADAMQAAMGGQ